MGTLTIRHQPLLRGAATLIQFDPTTDSLKPLHFLADGIACVSAAGV